MEISDTAAAVVALNAVIAFLQTPAAAPAAITEVDVVEGDTTEKFVPETPAQ